MLYRWNRKCFECATNYKFKDDTKAECVPDCSSITGCTECKIENNAVSCTKCGSKDPVDGKCTDVTPAECTLDGCEECADGDNSKCKKCYTNLGFVLEGDACTCNVQNGFDPTPIDASTSGKKCKCTDDTHTIFDGKCTSSEGPSKCPVGCTCAEGSDICTGCQTGYTPEYEEDGKTIKACNPILICAEGCTKCEGISTNCSECDEEAGYAKRNNVCVYCSNGIQNGQCKIPCPIEHCDPYYCFAENGHDYCTHCLDDYETNEEETACVERKEVEIPADACFEIVGCKSCNKDVPYLCSECDTDKNFVLEQGDCYCKSGFYPYEKECLDETKINCPESTENCKYCYNNKCLECEDNYYLVNNKCLSLSDCKIDNCATNECYYSYKTQNFYCNECIEGYQFNGNDVCVKETKSKDCNHILGCAVCSTVNREICYECDTENNFDEGRRSICACKDGYDLVDRKCVPPIPAVIPPKGPDAIPVDSLDKANEAGKVYKMDITTPPTELRLQENCENMVFNFLQPITAAVPIIPPKESTVVTLDVSNNGKFQIDHKNKNTNINGHGTIDINPIPKEGETINDLSLDNIIPEGDGLKLNSDVYTKTSISGNTNDGTTTTCNRLKVETRANLKADHITLKDVQIGLLSVLSLDKTVNVNDSKFFIYYNRSTSEKQYPIQFNNAFPEFTNNAGVDIKNLGENQYLPEKLDVEKLLIASFNDDGTSGNDGGYTGLMKSCESLKKRYNGGSGFSDIDCINGSNPEENVNLVATRADNPPKDSKKKKLSGGAIAGIVIACVVVVAAIIALLVYFLVIKKKNQSTTSTQGDSSIAI